jgi:hypothetical protein
MQSIFVLFAVRLTASAGQAREVSSAIPSEMILISVSSRKCRAFSFLRGGHDSIPCKGMQKRPRHEPQRSDTWVLVSIIDLGACIFRLFPSIDASIVTVKPPRAVPEEFTRAHSQQSDTASAGKVSASHQEQCGLIYPQQAKLLNVPAGWQPLRPSPITSFSAWHPCLFPLSMPLIHWIGTFYAYTSTGGC